MKTKISLLTGLLILVSCAVIVSEEASGQTSQPAATSLELYAPATLQPLVAAWAEEYARINPGNQIHVRNLTGEGIPAGAIAFGSAADKTKSEPGWNMAVGRTVIVPVINKGNPVMEDLMAKGLSAELLAKAVQEPGGLTWGELTGTTNPLPVRMVLSNDPAVINGLSEFLGISGAFSEGVIQTGEGDVASATAKDPAVLGFCRLATVTAPGHAALAGQIALAPIDKNGNGQVDYMEHIYDDAAAFARGVWIGKYPRALSIDIDAFSATAPSATAQTEFLKWVLTGGQRYLGMNGITDLVAAEVQSKIYRIEEITAPVAAETTAWSFADIAKIVLGGLALLALLTIGAVGFKRKSTVAGTEGQIDAQTAFDLKSVSAPKGLFYDKSHTWAFMEADGKVKVGIDDFLQQLTGTITRVEMRKPGEKITRGEPLVTIIQQGKHLKLYAPVSGTISQCNPLLSEDSSLINRAPFTDGWLYKIEPVNWLGEIPLLKMAAKYTQWLAGEWVRVKDFFTNAIRTQHLEYAPVILQDGGLLKDHLLEDFGPEVWEDFQDRILDREV